jgi:hypothetical protein
VLPETFRCQPARVLPPGRLSRAAMIAAGAALVTVQACGSSSHYGTAIVPDASADTSTSDGGQDAAAAAPLEQAPPVGDDRAPSPEPKKI